MGGYSFDVTTRSHSQLALPTLDKKMPKRIKQILEEYYEWGNSA